MSAQGGQKGGQQMQPQGQQWQNEMMTVPPGYFGDSFYSMGNSGRSRFSSDPNMGTGFPTGNANPLARPGMPTSPGNPNPLARGPNYNFGNPSPGTGGSFDGSGTGYNPLQGAGDQQQPNPYGSTNGTFAPPQGFDPNSQYTSFDWNNISPATRALLGYRG